MNQFPSIKKIILLVLLFFNAGIVIQAQQKDEYLTTVYDQLHWSPMQEKIKQIAPMPYGVVFLPWAGCTEQDMRKHFRMMKQLGFTNLKQTMPTPEWSERDIFRDRHGRRYYPVLVWRGRLGTHYAAAAATTGHTNHFIHAGNPETSCYAGLPKQSNLEALG